MQRLRIALPRSRARLACVSAALAVCCAVACQPKTRPVPEPEPDAHDLAVAACAAFAASNFAGSNAEDRYAADPGRAAALTGAVRDSKLAADRDAEWSDLADAIQDTREAALNGDRGSQLGTTDRAWELCTKTGLYVPSAATPQPTTSR